MKIKLNAINFNQNFRINKELIMIIKLLFVTIKDNLMLYLKNH